MGFEIDADSDRAVRTGEANVFDYNDLYVVMFWVRFDAVGGVNQYLWGIDDTSDGFGQQGDALLYSGAAGALNLRSTGSNNSGSASIDPETWYHVAIVRPSTTQLLLYLNGELEITLNRDIASRLDNTADRLEFGGFRVTPTSELDGGMSRIKIWVGRDMSEAGVESEMAYVDPQDTDGLWGYYPTYTPGPDINDWSGNGRHLTEEGDLTDYDDPDVNWAAVAPGAVSADAARVDPAIALSSMSVSPAARWANAARINPTVVLGGLAISPAARFADATRVNPTVILGGLVVSPAARTAVAIVVNPAVLYGATQVTPAAIVALASVVNPQIEAGDILVSPEAAFVACTVVAPTLVLSDVVVSPVAALAAATVVDPETLFGSVIAGPAAVDALALTINPIVALGDILVTAIADAMVNVGRPFIVGDFSFLVITLPYRENDLEFAWSALLRLVRRYPALSFDYEPELSYDDNQSRH